MFDPIQAVVAQLKASAAVAALVGSHVFGGILPEHFDPTNNPAIVATVKGGQSHSEIPEQTTDVQLVVWEGVNRFLAARTVYFAVYDALHGLNNVDQGTNGKIESCLESGVGQDMVDPDAGWAMVVCSYQVKMLKTS